MSSSCCCLLMFSVVGCSCFRDLVACSGRSLVLVLIRSGSTVGCVWVCWSCGCSLTILSARI